MINSTRNIRPPLELRVFSNRYEFLAELVSGSSFSCRRNVPPVGLVFYIGRRFARRGKIFRARARKNILGALYFIGRIAMYGNENSTLLQPSLIALGFKFRNAHTYESASHSADSAANSSSGQRRHDWSCCDEGAQSRDCQRADTDEPTECAANYCSRACACRGAFGCLGIFLGRNFAGAQVFG